MLQRLCQEFGSPAKNGLGHSVTSQRHPVTRVLTKCVFIPKVSQHEWNGEIATSSSVAHNQILDDDETAIRQSQLSETHASSEQALLRDLPKDYGVTLAEAKQKVQDELMKKLAAEAAKENDDDDGEVAAGRIISCAIIKLCHSS